MKKSLTQALGFCTALLLLVSACKKDEVRTVIQPGAAPTLTSSANNVVLLQPNSASNALTYTWTPATFGYPAAVTYTLQFDKKGGDFSAPVAISAGSNVTTKNLTVNDLNSVYQSKGLVSASAAPAATPLDVRVVASVGNTAPVITSAVMSTTATPYAFCAQPDAKQAWTIIGSVGPGADWSSDYTMVYDCAAKTYTYTGALKAGEYKFRYGQDWTTNLGGSSSTGGALTQGGDNLKIATAGTYTITLITPTIDATGKGSGSYAIK